MSNQNNKTPQQAIAGLLFIALLFLATSGSAVQNSVVVWGNQSWTNVPASVTNVASVLPSEAGIAVKRDGKIVAWGPSILTNVPAAMTNVIAVAARYDVGIALRADGTVINWTGNLQGTNAVAIAFSSGSYYGGAMLKTDGTVQTTGQYLTTVNSNVCAISSGYYSSPTALFSDGTVAGENIPPNILAHLTNVVWQPDNETTFRVWLKSDGTVVSHYYSAPANLTNVVNVVSGSEHALALKDDGTVVAWGNNAYQQTNVPSGLSNVIAIAAAGTRNLALKADGTVVGWPGGGVPAGLTNVAVIAANSSYSMAIVGNTPPTLISQPPDVLAWGGQPATFTVKAVGSGPLNYQWQLYGATIPNATNFFYRIPSVSAGHAGAYSVVVSNPYGTVLSRQAMLTLRNGPPILKLTPWLGYSVWEGQSVMLAVKADGSAPLHSQWFFEGTPINGAVQTLLTLTNLALDQTGDYWMVTSNAFGVRTSDVYSVTVRDPRPSFMVQQTNATVWWGTGVGFVSVGLGRDPMQYQWHFNGQSLPQKTNSTLYLYDLTEDNAGSYTVVLSNAWGMATSSVAGLTVQLTTGAITAWGSGVEGQNNVPTNLTTVSSIAAGGYYSMGLRPDGTVAAWGRNDKGQINVPAGLSNVTAIAAGYAHALALKSNGTVVAWGDPNFGPAFVPTGLSNVIAIAAGDAHSLALREDGTIIAWGGNYYNQTAVPAGLSNVVAISAGQSHNLALKTDGAVVAWGSYAIVPGGLSNVVAIAAGQSKSAVLRSDGRVIGWGSPVPPSLTNLVAIAGTGTAGEDFIGIRNDGTVVLWNGSTLKPVPPHLTNAVAVATGCAHQLVLTAANFSAPPVAIGTASKTNATFTVTTPTIRGWTYHLQYQDRLTAQWTSHPPVPGNGAVRLLSDPDSTDPQRFYRVWQKQ